MHCGALVIVTGVELRTITPDDWELWREIRLRALHEAPSAFGSTYAGALELSEADFRSRLDSDAPSIVALADGRSVGMGGGRLDIEGWLHVVSMWVDPELRGHGVGRTILERLVKWAHGHDLRVHLDVAVGNDAARRLYESYGFVGTGELSEVRPGSETRIERMALPS
jgi:ribosomal protein S18 acetylase RimI-like enzyme